MSESLQSFASAEPTIELVESWHDALVRERRMDADTARLRKTALRRLWEARDDSTAINEAGWMSTNLETLFDRLVGNGTAVATARTYKSRARSALQDFLFQRGRPNAVRSGTRKPKRSSGARSAGDVLREVPLDHGRTFRYELPDAFTRRDVQRITLHLLSLVQDVDATSSASPVQLQFDALVGLGGARKTTDDE